MNGLLLVNLGTPPSTETKDIKKYLSEFLMDPKVIDLPLLQRWLLVNLIIVPFRANKSKKAYEKIWTDKGSPLLTISESLVEKLNAEVHDFSAIKLAMRYGEPSIQKILAEFQMEGNSNITVLPLYPQYASATYGSSLEKIYEEAGKLWNVPNIKVIEPFFDNPLYLESITASIKESLDEEEHLVLSYHGLPERHIIKSNSGDVQCLTSNCCQQPIDKIRYCYKAQSTYITNEIAKRLKLNPNQFTMSFQSRLGKDPWLSPSTEEKIIDLAKYGHKKIAVACPSFLTDCLETLEEIELEGAEIFREHGGESLRLIPCLNDQAHWIKALHGIVCN